MRTVATTPQDVTLGDTADFGANDWLIEELREQFQADPGSVDSSWAAGKSGSSHVKTLVSSAGA